MMGTPKIEVGLTVVLIPAGNNARYRDIKPLHGKITKVGRKYFYIDGTETKNGIPFSLETLRQVTEYSADWHFYFSLQEYEEKKEYDSSMDYLRKTFGGYYASSDRLSLDQLRRIKAIMKEGE